MQLSVIIQQAFLSVPGKHSPAEDSESTSAAASSSKYLVLMVNVRGDLRLWDVSARKLVCKTTVAPLLTSQVAEITGESGTGKTASLVDINVDEIGNIVAHVSALNIHDNRRSSSSSSNSGQRVIRSFIWDTGLHCWLRASSEDYIHSSYYSTICTVDPAIGAHRHRRSNGVSNIPFPMQRLQEATHRLQRRERQRHGVVSDIAHLSALASESPEWSMVDTISHLQHQIAVAITLRDAAGFRAWLRTYVRIAYAHCIFLGCRI